MIGYTRFGFTALKRVNNSNAFACGVYGTWEIVMRISSHTTCQNANYAILTKNNPSTFSRLWNSCSETTNFTCIMFWSSKNLFDKIKHTNFEWAKINCDESQKYSGIWYYEPFVLTCTKYVFCLESQTQFDMRFAFVIKYIRKPSLAKPIFMAISQLDFDVAPRQFIQ